MKLSVLPIVLNYLAAAVSLYGFGKTGNEFLLPFAVMCFFSAKRQELREGE